MEEREGWGEAGVSMSRSMSRSLRESQKREPPKESQVRAGACAVVCVCVRGYVCEVQPVVCIHHILNV